MEVSNSEDEEIQTPGRILQLLKPVRNNPYSASPQINWFLINVNQRNGRNSSRYFFDLSRYSRYLPNVLPTVLKSASWRNWHTIFLLTPHREFVQWLIRFPMYVIRARKSGGLCYPKKVRKSQHRKKIKKRRQNKKGEGEHLIRPPQLALESPNEGLEHLLESPDPSELPILQSPNHTDSEFETDYSECEFTEDE